MVTTYSERVMDAMQARGISTAEMARRMGLSYQGIKKVLDGGQFNTANHMKACQVLHVNSEWLASGAGPRDVQPHADPVPEYAGKPRAAVRRVPIVGTARMGDNGFYEEISSVPGAGDGHIDMSTADPNAFGLRVRGNSMAPAIRDGWYVLIEPNAAPAVGEYVLIKLRDGQKMVKELLYQRADSIEVLSVNGGERRTIYTDELEAIQAVAAVVSPSKWKPA